MSDASKIYFGLTQGVAECTLPTCTGGPSTLALAPNVYVEAMAVDATNVYWFTDSNAGTSVQTCPKSGCGQTPITLTSDTNAVAESLHPQALAADGTNLYWANAAAQAIFRCSLPSCKGGQTPFATDTGRPIAVALDSTSVYWTSTSGSILRVAK